VSRRSEMEKCLVLDSTDLTTKSTRSPTDSGVAGGGSGGGKLRSSTPPGPGRTVVASTRSRTPPVTSSTRSRTPPGTLSFYSLFLGPLSFYALPQVHT